MFGWFSVLYWIDCEEVNQLCFMVMVCDCGQFFKIDKVIVVFNIKDENDNVLFIEICKIGCIFFKDGVVNVVEDVLVDIFIVLVQVFD